MTHRGNQRPGNVMQHTRTAPRVQRLTQQALRERGTAATARLREAMKLSAMPVDTAILSTALAEVAAEEGQRNPTFADAVRERYIAIANLRQSSTGGGGRTVSAPKSELIPIGSIPGWKVDPLAPPNPHALTQVYGRGQLARALDDYTVDALKETAAQFEAKFPGTKPTNRGQRVPLITYIVNQYDLEQSGG
jgi:hypothetical protein